MSVFGEGLNDAPNQLKASSTIFRDIFATSPACNAILNWNDKAFVEVNEGFSHLFGYRREEVLGHTPEELGINLKVGERANPYGHLHQRKQVIWREGRVQTRTGEWRDVIGSYMLAEHDGHEYIVCKLVDITPVRRLEKEVVEAGDRVQRRIAQDLHDGLGSDFTRISAKSQVLAQDLRDQNLTAEATEADEIARIVQQSVDNARRMVQGLLPNVLLDSGLQAALLHLSRRAEETGLRCTTELDGSIKVENPAVATHLYHIAQEALNNAAKHSKADRARVRLTCDEGMVRLIVSDNGVGFPDEILNDGAIAAERAALHSIRYRARFIRARVDFENTPEGGAQVVCTLPAENKDVHC